MNFTVMRSNIDELPAIMRLAQQLEVQLYLNLATDRTFLFRNGQVTLETRVDRDRIDAALIRAEQVLRRDRRFLPRYSELAYMRRHFDDLLQKNLPCAESQLKLMVHSTGEVGGCWGHDAATNVRDTPVAEILAARGLPGGTRPLLPQGVRRAAAATMRSTSPGALARTFRTPCGGWAGAISSRESA